MSELVKEYVSKIDFFEQKREVNCAIERIHKRIDEIRESQIRMEESSLRIEDFGRKISEVMYGKDEKGGLLSSVQSVSIKVAIHWALISVIFVGMIAIYFKS